MPRVTCYGGVGEIGGNKFLLEDRDARIFLDMGQTFDFLRDYFIDPWLMPRQRFGLRDYLALDLVPRIEGLYDAEKLEGTDLPWQQPEFDGIFISHCHFDHIFHLQFVDRYIPVYIGETARTIIQAWEDTAPRVRLGEHDYRPFRTGASIDVHGLDVEPIHVDHSVPGAYGFLVHTSEGTVVYTGDIRWHGPHGEMTEDFVEAAREARPEALITEGTRMAPEETGRNHSEEEVYRGVLDVIRNAKDRLVLATFYPRDIDRMRTFYMASLDAGREFITSARTAYLLKALESDKGLRFPKVFGDYGAKAYFRTMTADRGWEKAMKEELGDRAVESSYIHEHQEEVVLQLDFSHLTELVDIDPLPGSHFVHSKSEPFEEEDVEDSVLRAWLRRFRLHHHQLHASGHASRSELEDMVRRIRPKTVIPVHTENPQMFLGLASRVEIPEVGRPIDL
jgi:ribonuclease J